jgi:hypothetical protein
VPPQDTHANDNAAPTDRRRRPRRRVLLAGKLAYVTSSVTADCTIRNLSDDGALIIAPSLPLPRDPFLIVTKEATLHEAHVAWREGERSGLAFLATWRLDAEAPGAASGLRDLWLQLLPH